MFDVPLAEPCRFASSERCRKLDVNFAELVKSSRASFGSVFCFNVCNLANGIISQFVGRCQAVVWDATL